MTTNPRNTKDVVDEAREQRLRAEVEAEMRERLTSDDACEAAAKLWNPDWEETAEKHRLREIQEERASIEAALHVAALTQQEEKPRCEGLLCECGHKRAHAWEPGESCPPTRVTPQSEKPDEDWPEEVYARFKKFPEKPWRLTGGPELVASQLAFYRTRDDVEVRRYIPAPTTGDTESWKIGDQEFDPRYDFFFCPSHGLIVPRCFSDEWTTDEGCPCALWNEESCDEPLTPVYLDNLVPAQEPQVQPDGGERLTEYERERLRCIAALDRLGAPIGESNAAWLVALADHQPSHKETGGETGRCRECGGTGQRLACDCDFDGEVHAATCNSNMACRGCGGSGSAETGGESDG